jgi:hypothetical protein
VDEGLDSRGNQLKDVRDEDENMGKELSEVVPSRYDEHEQITKSRQISHLPDDADERDDSLMEVTVEGRDNISQSGEDDLIVNCD